MDRTGYIGASDVAPILEESEHDSRRGVWNVKTGRKPSFEGNKYTEWGHRKEPIIAKKFADEHPEMLVIDFKDKQFWREDFDILKTRPDRGLLKSGEEKMRLLEIKASGELASHWDSGLPISVWWQCQAQMFSVSDNPKFKTDFMYVALLKGSDYKEFKVSADLKAWQRIEDEVSKFWRLIETDTPPAFSSIDNIAEEHEPYSELLTEDNELDSLFAKLEEENKLLIKYEKAVKETKKAIEEIVFEKKADGYTHNGYTHKFIHTKGSKNSVLDQAKAKEYLFETLGENAKKFFKDKKGFSYSRFSFPKGGK